jgi:hypothetical protein
MVSPCSGGGTASPVPGAGVKVVVTAAAVESALILLGLEPAAAVLGPLIAGVTFDLTSLCSNDPPADPGLTQADVIAALNPLDFPNYQPAIQKVYTWFKSWYWYYACKCDAGATPAPSTPSNPGVVRGTDTGLPYASQAATCWDVTKSYTYTSATGLKNISSDMLPQLGPVTVSEPLFFGGTTSGYTVPSGITSLTLSIDVPTTVTNNVEAFLHFYNAAGAPVGSYAIVQRATTDNTEFHSVDFTVPAGGVRWMIAAKNADASNTHTFTVRLTYQCTGGQTFLQQSCCPPDESLTAQVAQILQMVTLVQRQIAPFGYVPGTVHSSLSGAGALSISGLIGVKVAIDTLPSHFGVAGTSPPEHFDLGYVTFGTTDGYPQAYRLTRNPQVMFPARAGLFTDLDYDLSPGVVVTITELKREP